MRFQATTEYAIRALVYLAKHPEKRLSARALHEALDIPYKYLSRLMSSLAEAGLVSVTYGKHGGYQVTRDLDTIYLYQIAEKVEGLEDYDRCLLGFPECSDHNPCVLHDRWVSRREEIKAMLYETTLADLKFEPTKNP
ncbi:MAG: Rrf2 family transcriptional regulator [Anaerolineales bacterium]|nr:Rrf2 family transcriptional regulator [Anaerolineales bacterium]